MPLFNKIRSYFSSLYLRATIVFCLVLAGVAIIYKPVMVAVKVPTPIIQSQDINEITSLVAKKGNIEYLLLAKPLSDEPRYIFKFKDAAEIHVVKVPSITHVSLEREILLKNSIPYGIAKKEFLVEHRDIFKGDEAEGGIVSSILSFLLKNSIAILMLGLFFYIMKNGMPGTGSKAKVIKPESLKGSMDDLIGMDDIKQEVAHLEEMILNRSLYKSHNIDKPFNVMLTGPAGTGKTKLAGYLAKKLNMPLISASGSGLESGFVGGGAKALNAIYKKACEQGSCIIFLDEAQSLFMPRGKGDKKWEDDTANTLLGLLDGVGVKGDEASRVIWVVASNFDDATTPMDEAMLRRFSVKINFRLPNKAERCELLKVFLSKKDKGCVDWENLNLGHVAEITANLSPALLESIVDRASMIAIQEKTIINTDVLFRAFERAAIGLTDRATSAEKAKQRERVAIHELGHFFMQIDPHLRAGLSLDEVKEKSSLLKISTESVSKLGALGYVLSAADDSSLRTVEELERDVMKLYGGVAAEELFYGARGISVGSQNDIQKATALLDLMVNRLSMYSRSKLDYTQLGSNSSRADAVKALEAKSDELYNNTLASIQDYKGLIDTLKDNLLEKYVLSKDEVFALLDDLIGPQSVLAPEAEEQEKIAA